MRYSIKFKNQDLRWTIDKVIYSNKMESNQLHDIRIIVHWKKKRKKERKDRKINNCCLKELKDTKINVQWKSEAEAVGRMLAF